MLRDKDGNRYEANLFGDASLPSGCSLNGPCDRSHINEYAAQVAHRQRWFGKRELLLALDEGNCRYRRDKHTASRMGDYLRRENLARFIPDRERDIARGRFAAGTYESLCSAALPSIMARARYEPATVPNAIWQKRPTTRQAEVAALIAAGLTNDEIAEQLVVGMETVKSHVTAILRKANCSSRTKFIARVGSLGLTQMGDISQKITRLGERSI